MSDELIVALSQVLTSQENFIDESAEEQATFGLFSVTANNHLLTEGAEIDKQELRHGPYVSGYPIAEWLAWNWWRLRWEARRPADVNAVRRWNFAHQMSSIGGGYAWPNITTFSDGVRSSLLSAPSQNPETISFRYFGGPGPQRVSVASLEMALDGFVEDILTRLGDANVRETNLHCLWTELKMEREDDDLVRFRRLEAQLGYDPDEADEDAIRRRLEDATMLGEEALGEIAADVTSWGDALENMMSAKDLVAIAQRSGFDANPNDAITLNGRAELPQPGEAEAWRLGKLAAQAIRIQADLDGSPISDTKLTDLAGVEAKAISGQRGYSTKISFAFDADNFAKVALRSRQKTARRFHLARLIGDRLLRSKINAPAEPMFPRNTCSQLSTEGAACLRCGVVEPIHLRGRHDG